MVDYILKPKPFKHLFSTSNFTSTLLDCFVLEYSDIKTTQLRCVLVMSVPQKNVPSAVVIY